MNPLPYQKLVGRIQAIRSYPKNGCQSVAFTLLELLVVIAIIGIIAGLLLPVLTKAKGKGHQISCLNSLRQIGVGFQLYCSESDDMFPTPGSREQYGPQPEDWIWWQYGRDVSKSKIGSYIGGFSPKLFTCPADTRAQLLQTEGEVPNDPYRYSYSLTSYNLTKKRVNPGMATIITQFGEIYPFKTAQIKNPGLKIMLVEESAKTINDSRWAQPGDLISDRHGGKGNVVFADQHIELETPTFGKNPTNSNPTL